VPFRRRERPLHERLAEQGGLTPPPREPEPLDPVPAGNIPGYGVHATRRWDAVVSAVAEGLPGDEVHFVALPDGTVVVDEDVPDDSLAPLADALEEQLEPPYRAEGVRRGSRVWAVAGRRVEIVEVPEDVSGDTLELGVHGGERTVVVDGMPAFHSLPSLERLAAERGHAEYVIRGERVDGPLWEVTIAPL
jgi:hypothetical protein